jgi:hypothetical protein
MKIHFKILILTALLLAGIAITVSATANAPSSYQINWDVIAGGGGPSTSSSYAVNATIGQPVIGPAEGASKFVGAGYWYHTLWELVVQVFLPLVLR